MRLFCAIYDQDILEKKYLHHFQEVVKVCWRMGCHRDTNVGPLSLLLTIKTIARSSVLFVSVCQVTPLLSSKNDVFTRKLDGTYELWCAHIKDTKSQELVRGTAFTHTLRHMTDLIVIETRIFLY
jgi:hypothetical protein